MVEIQMIPGAIVTPNAITLPATAPDIEAVVAAQIVRTPAGATVPDHLAAAVQASVAVADHPAADIQASTPIDDHAVHGHDITTVVAAGGGGAVTDPLVPGPLESAGGGQVNAGAVDDNAAAQVHAFGAGVVTAHAYGAGVVTAHGASVGADPVVAAVPTGITTRTFSLDVSTVLGDILTIQYLEVGERVLVS